MEIFENIKCADGYNFLRDAVGEKDSSTPHRICGNQQIFTFSDHFETFNRFVLLFVLFFKMRYQGNRGINLTA